MLWGLKQDFDVLLSWLKTKSPIYYVSHPISEPRKLEQNGAWPPIVDIINAMQRKFGQRGLHTVMPTAIDEFRFEKDRDSHFTGRLGKRWPIPSGVERLLKQSNVLRADYEATNIFQPMRIAISQGNVTKTPARASSIQDYLDGSFAAIETNITKQLANRDHLLVWLSDGIIVVEPWSTRSRKIHRGVMKEMRYLSEVNDTLAPASRKRTCAIFLASSVRQVAREPSFQSAYLELLRNDISRRHNIRRLSVDNLLTDDGELRPASAGSLGPEIPAETFGAISASFRTYQDDALAGAFLAKTMVMTEEDKVLIMPICVDNLRESLHARHIDNMKTYLTGTKDSGREYNKLVELLREARN